MAAPDERVDALLPWLERSRALGFLGPGALDEQVRHALGFAGAVGEPPAAFVDLGSGGGLPGLVLAAAWDAAEAVLVDGNERRSDFLREAVEERGWAGRVEVVRARAEEVGRDRRHRGRYPVVVARGFGPPAVTAECAAPLLAVGGILVVSEPPQGEPGRWPREPLRELGLDPEAVVFTPARFQRLRQVRPAPERFPRRVGVPAKRPLYVSRETP